IMNPPLLSIRDLAVEFDTREGPVRAVDGVSIDVCEGETLGIVGESGSGKTVTFLATMGLLPTSGRVVAGQARLDGHDLLAASEGQLRRIRGRRVGMVFQDPMTSLHPMLRVGPQIAEALQVHDRSMSRAVARSRVVELLASVGVPDPAARYAGYPHQWSGGMRQRAMIAMAVANAPALLIADEPTTALDVTIQAQVLEVLKAACAQARSAAVLITHDLGVIAEVADRVAVMYAGRIVETAPVEELFEHPRHPYTVGLLAGRPRLDGDLLPLVGIPGRPPDPANRPTGCAFHPRCSLRDGRQRCVGEDPPLEMVAERHRSACHFSSELER
ncbi:MAG TPA: ABC transporter ATP-binding protein, partial [Euzebya sp.]|nr:ABC transporter ATP-binding protein [Euzebya sp.]